MAYSKIIHTKSEAVGSIPSISSLSFGEIAINYSDGHLYIKKADNTIRKVASSDFPVQISALLTDVNTLTNRLDFIALQQISSESLTFGRDNLNANDSFNSLAFGLSNTVGTAGSNSALFGTSNNANADSAIAFGAFNTCNGANGIAIGRNITVPADVAEFGYWSTVNSRASTIRCGSNNVGISIRNTDESFDDGGAVVGEEVADTLPREMYAIRRNEDEILLDVNIGGTITTCSFGESTDNGSNTSVGAAIQNDRSDTTTVASIRKLTQTEYDDLFNSGNIESSTVYLVTAT
jgi:hypothetical protein